MKKLAIIFGLLSIYIAYQFYDTFDPDEAGLRGKCVVITGASSGIGEQTAYQFSRYGANVLVTARREHLLQKVVARCKELGAQSAHYIVVDMSKLNETRLLIDEAKNKMGGIDHLILNHILTGHYMQLWNENMEFLERLMTINFLSYVSLATHATPMLNESNGAITVISSFAGKVGMPFAPAYSAAKFALDGFFSARRQEFKILKMDISVTLCVLGSIITDNAVEATKHIMRPDIFYSTAEDAAYVIMRGATLREREVYFPWIMTRPGTLLRDFFIDQIELGVRETGVKPDAKLTKIPFPAPDESPSNN